MDIIQAVLTDYTKLDIETQTGEVIRMPEFEDYPTEYRYIIGTVRDYVVDTRGKEFFDKMDNEMEQFGIEDLDMNIDMEDVKAWLRVMVSFVPGLMIDFVETYQDDYDYELSDGDVEIIR